MEVHSIIRTNTSSSPAKSVSFLALTPTEVIPIPIAKMNAKGAYGNKSSPNKSPSPKQKKIYRDQLNGRLRKQMGKQGSGSRRNTRWKNGTDLGRPDNDVSDSGPAEDEFESFLFDSSQQNIFYQMFEDEKLHAMWQPFLDITEEEEQMLLSAYSDSESSEEYTYSSHNSFQRISTEGKRSLSKYAGSDFLLSLDEIVFSFLANPHDAVQFVSEDFSAMTCETNLHLFMKNSFHRSMAHNIAIFYDLNSQSVRHSADQEKIVVISSSPFIPTQSLVSYLKTHNSTPLRDRTRSNRKRATHQPQFTDSYDQFDVLIY